MVKKTMKTASSMRKTLPGPTGFRVGDRVKITFGNNDVEGVIVEDRGPFGGNGAQLFSIQTDEEGEPCVFEMPVYLLKAVK